MAFDFVEYMQNVATKLKEIQHVEGDEENTKFFKVSSLMNLDELIQCLGIAKFPAIIVEDNRLGRFIDRESENLLDQQSHSFMVIKNVSIADADDRKKVIKECEAIVDKIWSRMFRDMRNDNNPTFPKTGLRNLDRNSITYQTVGPLGDNCHGIMPSFSLLKPKASEVVFNENDWIS